MLECVSRGLQVLVCEESEIVRVSSLQYDELKGHSLQYDELKVKLCRSNLLSKVVPLKVVQLKQVWSVLISQLVCPDLSSWSVLISQKNPDLPKIKRLGDRT